jgi:hypothetical protein
MMQPKSVKALLGFAALLTCSHAAPTQRHGFSFKHQKAAQAIYLITNDASNAVAAVPIGADGMLSAGTVTPTGGDGANLINGATNEPAAPDALFSQSSLTIAGNVSDTRG